MIALYTAALVLQSAALIDLAWRFARRLYGEDLVAAAAAGCALWTAMVVAILEVLGTIGALQRGVVLAVTAGVWAVGRLWLARRAGPDAEPPRWSWTPRLPRSPVEWGSAIGVAALLAVLVVAVVEAVSEPTLQFDALYYHLPIAVQWLQHGNTRLLPYIFPNGHAARFPAAFELIELWLLIPVHRDFLVQLAGLPGAALMMSGVALLARELGAGVRSALAGSLVVVTLPTVLVTQIGGDLTDLFMAGAVTACAGFIARYSRSGSVRDLVLAGATAGLAVASRYQALVELLPLVAIAVVVLAVRPGPIRVALRAGAGAAATMLAVGGYFYVRNAAATGNPLYPKRWSLPLHPFPGARQTYCCDGPSLLQLGWHPSLWAHKTWQILFANSTAADTSHSWGPMLALLVLGGMLVPVLASARRRERDAVRWGWSVYPIAQFVCYLATPLSAGPGGALAVENSRFLLATAAASASLLVAEAVRLRRQRRRQVLAVTLLLAGASTLAYSRGIAGAAPVKALAAFLLIAATGAVVAARRVKIRPGRAVAGAATALGVVLVAFAAPLRHHYEQRRSALPYADAAMHLRPGDSIVSLVGVCQLYPLYGPDLRRRVEYLTGQDGRDPLLATTYSAWVGDLVRHHVTAVVVNPDSEVCFRPHLPQALWAALHPDRFRLMYVAPRRTYGRTVLYAFR